MDQESRIELRVLGTPELRGSAGSDLGELLSQPKRIALLSYLALAKPRGFHRRQVLFALFWPESNEQRARAALRQTVHAIRQRLGRDIIVNRGEDEMSANAGRLWCDAANVDESLARGDCAGAVALYRGDLLPGFFVDGAPGFQEWLDAERRELRQRAAEAALSAAVASEPGSPAGIAMTRKALDLAPADEAVARGAMQLLAASDPAAALRVYDHLALVLQKEYEVAPSESTQSLAASLGRGQPGPVTSPRSPRTGPAVEARSAVGAAMDTVVGEVPRAIRHAGLARVLAGVAIVAAAAGLLWASTSLRRPTVDENVVAVLPFRVTATDSSHNYLREGVVDILNAQLTGDGVPASVDARVVLNALHRKVASSDEQLTIREAVALGRRLGAGRVIIGEFVSSPTSVTLSARMIATSNERVISSHTASSSDGAVVLTTRVLSALLAASVGEDRERLSHFTDSTSAVKAYLAGMAAYRRGHLAAAQNHFRAAFEIDTSFVAAAFWRSMATADPSGPDKYAADSALWRLRDRLSRRDKAIVATLWSYGPRYPNPSTILDFLQAHETAANANPDRPEPWLAWGNTLSFYGPQVGFLDYATRSAAILDSALAMDSTLVPVLNSRLRLAVRMRDGARVRSLAKRLTRASGVDSASAALNRWLVAVVLGDSSQREQAGMAVPASNLFVAVSHAAWMGLSLSDLENAARKLPGPGARFDIAAIRGRTSEALAKADSLPVIGAMLGRSITTFVTLALVEPGYDAAARSALGNPLALPDSAAAGMFRSTTQYRAYHKCYTELWRAHDSGAPRTRVAADEVRRLIRASNLRALSASVGPLDVCPLLLDFFNARNAGGAQAAAAIERLDSLLRHGAGRDLSAVVANLIVADWKEKRGDYAGALSALRRRIAADHRLYYLTAPAYLRAEGRVAAQAGDTAGAIAAYSAFLALRDQPDTGSMHDQVARVRSHFAQLTRASGVRARP